MTSTTVKTSSTADKKDVQKLQRAIVDGLEDVKAQDIQVFDTEHITSLFERVIVASGTSNRQTKALAASVRDAVREAGFAKPRIEGEENGEWIIVDCGAAVAHIMQPTIRQYYHLEELWGEKPVKTKLGAASPLPKVSSKIEVAVEAKPAAKRKVAAKSGVKAAGKTSSKAEKAPAKAPAKAPGSSYVGRVGKTNDWTAKRNATATAAEPAAKTSRVAAKKAPAKSAARPATKTPIVKVPAPKKVAAKKAVAKTAAKTAAKKPAAKKTSPRSK
ncbi:ribosome silencing factor [Polaromonas jejuensis]|uniref:Ribosomal silencing factor RsfS n=1 Tax=Polaromonas jejuensis TaxID=457502 RepID=A0ABW0QF93_9BURK|nr:ribosome silencing factor [Polaromonas jejuensis]